MYTCWLTGDTGCLSCHTTREQRCQLSILVHPAIGRSPSHAMLRHLPPLICQPTGLPVVGSSLTDHEHLEAIQLPQVQHPQVNDEDQGSRRSEDLDGFSRRALALPWLIPVQHLHHKD